MNLTDVLLFGKSIICDCGDSSDGGRLFLHKQYANKEAMEQQPSIPMNGFSLYKFFDETPTAADVTGCHLFFGGGVADESLPTEFMRWLVPSVAEMDGAWAITNDEGAALVMCLPNDTAETLGVSEGGIYIADFFFDPTGIIEAYFIGA